jgi:putative ABC transport system permease protein
VVRAISVAYWSRHSFELVVLVMVIAFGVAAIVASGTLIQTSQSAARASLLPGTSDLRVSNGFAGVPETLVEEIRSLAGVAGATGFVTGRVTTELGEETATLAILGMDMLADAELLENVLPDGVGDLDPAPFIARKDAAAMSVGSHDGPATRSREGSQIRLARRSGTRSLHVVQTIEAPEVERVLGPFALMDLPAAQFVLGTNRLVTWIDVVVDGTAHAGAVADDVERVAGPFGVVTGGGDSSTIDALTSNVRLIVGFPGVMALVVGAMLVLNVAGISVTRRKDAIDIVRACGASARVVRRALLLEALAIGLVASLCGNLLGVAIAAGARGAVVETISTLYLDVQEHPLEISWIHQALATLVALGASSLAFVQPIQGRPAHRGSFASGATRRVRERAALRSAAMGAPLLVTGFAAVELTDPRSISGEALALASAIPDAAILMGAALLVPALLSIADRHLPRRGAAVASIARHGVLSDPGRTGAAVACVAVATAYALVTITPIASLRDEIGTWVRSHHSADLTVAASGSLGFFPNAETIPRNALARIERLPGVARVEPSFRVAQPFGERWAMIIARSMPTLRDSLDASRTAGSTDRAIQALRRGTGGPISRHFAEQHDLGVGDRIQLKSPSGTVAYDVEAVLVDYSSADLGSVFVSEALLRDAWQVRAPVSAMIWLSEPGPAEEIQRLREAASEICDCDLVDRRSFVGRIDGVIASLFHVAYVLEAMAIAAVVVSIAGFAQITRAERNREFTILRRMGASRRQIRSAAAIQGVTVAVLGNLVGAVLGWPLAARVTESTMNAGAGFTLQAGFPLGTTAALLAGSGLVSWWVSRLVWRAPRRSEAGSPFESRSRS